MNWQYQNIRTLPATLLILCGLVTSLFASGSVGKTNDVYRKNIACIDHERDVLLNIKNNIDTNDECGFIASWGNPNSPDCCTWHGVSCSNQSGYVIGLYLSGAPYDQDCWDFTFHLTPFLGDLKHLKYLDLSSNDIYGKYLVGSIGSLVNLVYLNLSRSVVFSWDNIPAHLGNLTSLTFLDLSNVIWSSTENFNWLSTGNFNWLSRLTLLRNINLSGIDLSNAKDWLRIIGSLPLLEVLKIDHCQLSTPPSLLSFLHQSANLRVISLSGNNFSSFSSFQTLFNTSNYPSTKYPLKYLDLSNNFLQGPIPDTIGSLEFLTYLDLSRNLLSSTIQLDAIGNLKFLTYLNLSHNLLPSVSPHAITNLQSLRYMDLSFNALTGPIPSTLMPSGALGTRHSLSYLDLSHNRLEGSIPSAIGDSHSISHIDLSNNRLQGSIPSSLGGASSLSHLDFSYNDLQGPIPSSLGGASSLSYLDFSYNQLQGPIPSSLGGPSSLFHLDFSNNYLEGAIPGSIANLEYLGYLDLSRNNLIGDIPCKLEITMLPYFANFSNNNLSGSIPKHLSYLRPDSFQGNPSFRIDKIQGRCDKINIGLYVSIGLGFYTGFWAFCGTLTVKNSWRHAYFRFIDHIIDKIYVIVAVNMARFRRNYEV